MTNGLRRIWLCADDYGIAPGVNTAIRDLIARGRLNATSVMVVAPHFNRSDALALSILNSGTTRTAIGLHLTLTAPFRPMTEHFRPLTSGHFLPLGRAMIAAFFRRYRPEPLRLEIAAQLTAFATAFGRPPDFIDGHQHVHLLPQIRDSVIEVGRKMAPQAWMRQCIRAPHMRRPNDRKGAVLDRLGDRFCRLAKRKGVEMNTAFSGTYDFQAGLDFASLFPSFVDGMPEFGLVMCHPGFPDAELAGLDTLTFQRQREYDFFAGDAFPLVLEEYGVTLA